MNTLKQIGIIDLDTSKHDITYQSLLVLYWSFFDATDYESHLLANDKLLRTVMSNEIYPDLYLSNATYQLDLNRRLIDLAWLYIIYKENAGKGCDVSVLNHQERYRPKFCYSYKSTYYFDEYSCLHMEFDRQYKPFKRVNDYMEVIYRFKGKVRWLSLDEIENPYMFYRSIFENRNHLDWIQLFSKWGEYTFLPKSICLEMDGGEVYDTYVLFQKLTEMAYLVNRYEDYIPDSRKFLYANFGEYPSHLTIDEIISPQIVVFDIFGKSTIETVLNEMFWWLDSVLHRQEITDFKRVYSIYISVLRIAEFCWVFKPYKRPGIGLKDDDNIDENTFYSSFFESLNYQTNYVGVKERSQPLSALNWIFSRYQRELGYLRSLLSDCFDASFGKRSSSPDDVIIESLKTNCAQLIELAYLFHMVLQEEKE
ncbi:MAG: hypothetical protein ACN6PN_05550 [Sphingobacterium sp.]